MRTIDSIRESCAFETVQCYATYAIFKSRADRLRHRLQFLAFLGMAVPGSVGFAFMSYGANSKFTTLLLSISSDPRSGRLPTRDGNREGRKQYCQAPRSGSRLLAHPVTSVLEGCRWVSPRINPSRRLTFFSIVSPGWMASLAISNFTRSNLNC
jgi:hypothetical protein